MLALARAAAAPDYPAEVVLVLSNVPGAPGLDAAAAMGLPTATLPHRAFATRADFDSALADRLDEAGAEIVALAGFMRILTPAFINRFKGRIVNIHPSLLPLYPGLETHARAIAAGDREAGCTVHLVTDALDSGPILGQSRVPILAGDTPEALAARILPEEHRLYPVAVADLARRLP
jgi:phosphoribosylglycinamide formyltransferase-1